MKSILTKNDAYIFIAVRMKSSRLPLKAMIDISGKPLLLRLVERLSECISLDKIVICTSTHGQDDEIEVLLFNIKLIFLEGVKWMS